MKRSAGILMPIASLPGGYGIGGFDKNAYQWVDTLAKAHQSYWQILPLGPTSYGDSPYQSFSTFAGNPYFIALDTLVAENLLLQAELPVEQNNDVIDYAAIYNERFKILRQAFGRFNLEDQDFQSFCDKSFWLEDYALFMALKDSHGGASWDTWEEELRLRKEEALAQAKEDLAQDISFYKFLQYKFFQQWGQLKAYANEKNIKIIGDIPIYVAYDSADTWANTHLFQFDEHNQPIAVAGCPPDGFSADGQLWGNPLYNWPVHEQENYAWWIQRVKACYEMYDMLRIDHFRGFDEYYAIPFGSTTAKIGAWEQGPGIKLFKAINEALGKPAIIAEDLGYLTDSVIKLLKDTGYPGMKVLQFGFDARDSSGANHYLPHNYTCNSIAYTGTHDNETTMGWFNSITAEEKAMLCKYLNLPLDASHDELMDQAIFTVMRSKSALCIIPIQDYLHLDNTARINTPSTLGGNWSWKMKANMVQDELITKIADLTDLTGRSQAALNLPSPEEVAGLKATELYPLMVEKLCHKDIKNATTAELYYGLLLTVKYLAAQRPATDHKGRKLYYISAEFLIGKLLSNNLINLGIFAEVEEFLAANGQSLTAIEEFEPEPSLGNGGLGRLAACFLDSIATLNLPGDGIGLNYHLGLFKQKFINRKQAAVANPWIENISWLNKTDRKFTVQYKDFSLQSTMYDIDVLGYKTGLNKLHLFDVDQVNEDLVAEGITFDLTKVKENLTLFLYPDDSTHAGKMLRLYQQYFMVSSGAQLILAELKEAGKDLRKLHEHVCVQINDTHPSMVIPELINLLVAEGIEEEEAINIVAKTCAYTNHTILAEALEKWPLADLEEVAPQLVPTIKKLDEIAKKRTTDPSLAIIDENNLVHMAHMDIHFGYSINGVAYLHTEILKNSELKGFYELYPEKFNNKTNGITFRRWLIEANKPLSQYLEKLIGPDFKTKATELEKLLQFKDDEEVLNNLGAIKTKAKENLAKFLAKTQGKEVNPQSIFDIQIKRLHEYKRQQLNLLYIIDLYSKIKAGFVPQTPITFIFGAKAAPAYIIAQDIIHAILCLQDVVAKDPVASKYINIVMVENYNVTMAEKLIPACDISEQISLASKEASGTGNMKFMLNGALTLGTEDGANVEIHQLVGDDNIFIFGESSDAVIKHYEKADYVSKDYYDKDEDIKGAIDFLVSEEMLAVGDVESLTRLQQELINKDWFMTLLDFRSYVAKKNEALAQYENKKLWQQKCLVNIAKAGFFSADRTIEQYNQDIWHLK